MAGGKRSMYLIRPPLAYRWLFREGLFRKEKKDRNVYLTFDDGPHPEATEFVLEVLKRESVKATFFMLGRNAMDEVDLVERVKRDGHRIGNHGMNHLNGWSTGLEDYGSNCEQGKRVLGSSLFRPPYGRLSISQYNLLKKDNQIVFWDVISADFDQAISAEQVIDNVLKNVRNGSIIVMHDSQKALTNLKGSLQAIIKGLKKQGFGFRRL